MSGLHLHEEALLLGLHDEKGKLTASMATYAMGGGILAEFLLAGRIAIAPGKRPLVDLVSDEPFGDPILDEGLERIATAKRRAVLSTWVSRLAGMKKLVRRTAEGLCERGILREEDKKVLLVFEVTRYPEHDSEAEAEILARIKAALESDALDIDARTVALIALTYHASVLNAVFDKSWLKSRKERVKELVDHSQIGDATRDAITAVQTAVLMSTVITTTVVTT